MTYGHKAVLFSCCLKNILKILLISKYIIYKLLLEEYYLVMIPLLQVFQFVNFECFFKRINNLIIIYRLSQKSQFWMLRFLKVAKGIIYISIKTQVLATLSIFICKFCLLNRNLCRRKSTHQDKMKVLTKIFHLEFVFAKSLLFCSENTRKYRTFLLFWPS